MYVETDCTITHEGKTFEAGGAVVTDEYAVGYYQQMAGYDNVANAVINTWHGMAMGPVTQARKFRQWNPTSGSYINMIQVYALIDGVEYTGRTQGSDMIWKGKRVAKQ